MTAFLCLTLAVLVIGPCILVAAWGVKAVDEIAANARIRDDGTDDSH